MKNPVCLLLTVSNLSEPTTLSQQKLHPQTCHHFLIHVCVCVWLVTFAIICRIWFSVWGGLRTPSPSRRRRLLRIFLFFSSKLRLPLATSDWFLFIFSGVRASWWARRCISQSWHIFCVGEETTEVHLKFTFTVLCVCVCTWSCDADTLRMSLRESPDWVLMTSMISCFVLKEKWDESVSWTVVSTHLSTWS